MRILTVLFILLLGCILSHSQTSLRYAALGLELWFQKMIPSLLPFMILSGIMIRMKLTDKVSMMIYPLVNPLYKVQKTVCYAMLMGFLCGFPMGARVVDDLYMRRMITKREAEYLLAFCNNIGPVYFCSFVLPLLGRELILPYLFGMYGIPLLYGLILRYTAFKDLSSAQENPLLKENALPQGNSLLQKNVLSKKAKNRSARAPLHCCENRRKHISLGEKLLEETDDAIHSSVQSILSLGGYMILFNLLNLVPHILAGRSVTTLSPLLEITGGLMLLGDSLPLYSLLALSSGGLSCLAQTYSTIRGSDLSIGSYIRHKIILTLLNGFFYLCWFLLLPASFLR